MIQKQGCVAVSKYSNFVKKCSSEVPKTPNERIIWAISELSAEAGECQSLATKAIRRGQDVDLEKLWGELGDTLWGVYCVMNEAFPDNDIEDLMEANMDKLDKRYGLR